LLLPSTFVSFAHNKTKALDPVKKSRYSYSEEESNLRLQSIIDTVIDGIIVIDERGVIELANPAAAELFEYSQEEMVGNNISMLMPSPHQEAHDGYLRSYLRTGHAKIIGIGREVPARKKSGEIFSCRLAVSEVDLGDRKVFTGILHDLSDLKLSQEKLRRYAAELERSNRELQDFAYISSHDLQEPLRKIQAFGSRVVGMEKGKLSEKGEDYLGRMLNAAQRMQALINALLSYSRVSTKANPFQQVDLNKILREVLSDLEVAIEKAGVSVETSGLPSLEADPMQMRQLLQNLIGNAIKFSKAEAQSHIKLWVEDADSAVLGIDVPSVTLFVQDNGIGFEERYLDRVFNIFQRLEGRKYQGSGVGLAICKKIVVRHGGFITASSKPGEGATFMVTLPLRQVEKEEA
jgi:two-component system sensor kinase FixL